MRVNHEQEVPRLRFAEFEGAWELQPVGKFISEHKEKSALPDEHEVLTSSRSGLMRQKEYYDNERITDRENIGFNIIPKGYLTYRSRSDDRRFFFNKNDLGITGIISTYYPVFTIINGDIDFFRYLFTSKEKYIGRYSVGTSQTVLSLTELRKIKFRAPGLKEQKKIAAFLGVMDEKLNGLQRKRDLLDDYKRGVMQKIFSRQIRFKRDDGRNFPDWKEKRLGEVFDWVRTNNLSREFLNYESGDVQNIHYGDIHTKFKANFRQSSEAVPFINASALQGDFTDDEYCQPGDVVIADASEDYADIGKAIEIVEVRAKSLVAGLHTHLARPRPGATVLGFSGYLLRSAPMRKQIMRIAQGVSVLGISKTNLEHLSLCLPHPNEQRKIADFLSALDAKIHAVTDQAANIEAFKKGLLQQMFV